MANRVGAMTQRRLEHEGERVGDFVRLEFGMTAAFSKVSGSGPWPDMQLCSEAPPGRTLPPWRHIRRGSGP